MSISSLKGRCNRRKILKWVTLEKQCLRQRSGQAHFCTHTNETSVLIHTGNCLRGWETIKLPGRILQLLHSNGIATEDSTKFLPLSASKRAENASYGLCSLSQKISLFLGKWNNKGKTDFTVVLREGRGRSQPQSIPILTVTKVRRKYSHV
jgi:hypothetical protein